MKRPGRIHTAIVEIVETSSIAIGANGGAARDVPLLETGDQADLPLPRKTKKIVVSGMLGSKDGTTLEITQARPGWLQVRDYVLEEKL